MVQVLLASYGFAGLCRPERASLTEANGSVTAPVEVVYDRLDGYALFFDKNCK